MGANAVTLRQLALCYLSTEFRDTSLYGASSWLALRASIRFILEKTFRLNSLRGISLLPYLRESTDTKRSATEPVHVLRAHQVLRIPVRGGAYSSRNGSPQPV